MYDRGQLEEKIKECDVFLERGKQVLARLNEQLDGVKTEMAQLVGKRTVYLDLLNQTAEEGSDVQGLEGEG